MFPFLFGLYQFINAFNRNTPSIIKNIGTIKQGLSLIVVDDALVRRLQGWCTRHLKVSILVVLDDALVLVEASFDEEDKAKSQSLLCWTML